MLWQSNPEGLHFIGKPNTFIYLQTSMEIIELKYFFNFLNFDIFLFDEKRANKLKNQNFTI